jgi:hypothetical protein
MTKMFYNKLILNRHIYVWYFNLICVCVVYIQLYLSYIHQDLSIVVSSELDDDDVDIIEDNEEVSAVNVLCFVDDTEWTVRDFVYSEPRQFNKEIAETQFKNPALLVKCVATRNAGFFLYNIILIMVSLYLYNKKKYLK